jgi:RES domain
VTERLEPPNVSRFPPLGPGHLRTLDRSALIGRIFFTSGEHPTAWNSFRSFGPTTSRFDHHPPPRRQHRNHAILYGAPLITDANGIAIAPLDTCLAEVFITTGMVDVRSGSPYFALFEPTRPLHLLDMTDSGWITAAGGNAGIYTGPRVRAREWARAIYAHYAADSLDGLYYGSSAFPPGRSVALFERAQDAIPPHPRLRLALSDPALRDDIEYGCGTRGFVIQ